MLNFIIELNKCIHKYLNHTENEIYLKVFWDYPEKRQNLNEFDFAEESEF